jgi:hypothetical protein
MFVTIKENKNIILIKDGFLSVSSKKEIDDVEITYSVVTSQLFKNNAFKVVIKLLSAEPTVDSLSNILLENVDPKITVNKILRNIPDIKNSIRANNNLILGQINSDPTSKISNENIGVLKKAINENIPSFFKRQFSLKQVNEILAERSNWPVQNVLSQHVTGAASRVNEDLFFSLILMGIDPSEVANQKIKELGVLTAESGVIKNLTHETNPILNSLNDIFTNNIKRPTTIKELAVNELVPIFQQEQNDTISITEDIFLKKHILEKYKTLFVSFDLIDKDGIIIDSKTKRVDISKLFEAQEIVTDAPQISVAAKNKFQSNVEITSKDKNASKVRLYSKNIFDSKYSFVDEIDIKAGHARTSINTSIENIGVLRAIFVNKNGQIGQNFSNFIFKPKRNILQNSVLTYQIFENGIKLEASKFPPQCVSFVLLRRDKTLFENNFSIVSKTFTLINNFSSILPILDGTVKNKHSYEYKVQYELKDGRKLFSIPISIEYLKLSDSIAKLSFLNQQINTITDTEFDFGFNIDLQIQPTNEERTRQLLEQQGIAEFFSGSLQNIREKFQDLLSYSVVRFDLTTGLFDNIGVISSTQFKDSDYGKLFNLEPLTVGHKYRYEISAFFREAETLLDSYVKDVIDKFNYSFKPSKYKHPLALENGNLTDLNSRNRNHGKDPMLYGFSGITGYLDVSYDATIPTIINQYAYKASKYVNTVSWEINGQQGLIDHFIIVAKTVGISKIIGKCHGNFTTNSIQFIHKLEKDDVSSISYRIIPIYYNYKIGQEYLTNEVL